MTASLHARAVAIARHTFDKVLREPAIGDADKVAMVKVVAEELAAIAVVAEGHLAIDDKLDNPDASKA